MSRPSRVPVRRSALLAAACLAAGFACAADPPRKAPTDKVLTPEQLRECLAQKDRLRAQTDDTLKDKAALDADKAEIDRSGTALGEQLAALDRTSVEAVQAYVDRANARESRIDAYQARVSAYNAKAERVKAAREAYEKSCENRRFDERDLNDLKRSK